MDEIWVPIHGWIRYEASSLGRIRPVGRSPMRPVRNKFGHMSLVLYRGDGSAPKKQWVHRLICAAFHGDQPSPGMHAAHGNGDAADNRPANLRWATPVENAADKKRHGRENVGSRNAMAKLSEADIPRIIERASSLPRSSGGARIKKGAIKSIATEFNVTPGCIRGIITGRRWASIKSAEDH